MIACIDADRFGRCTIDGRKCIIAGAGAGAGAPEAPVAPLFTQYVPIAVVLSPMISRVPFGSSVSRTMVVMLMSGVADVVRFVDALVPEVVALELPGALKIAIGAAKSDKEGENEKRGRSFRQIPAAAS